MLRADRRPALAAAAVFGVVGLVVALAGSGRSTTEAGSPIGSSGLGTIIEDPSAPVLDLSEKPIADDPDPNRRAGASSNFIDCEHGTWSGGWSMDFGPSGSAAEPGGAVLKFVEDGLFGLPITDWVDAGQDQHRRLFTYSFGGQVKAAVIVADSEHVPLDAETGWVVETFASCDPAEFDPAIDVLLPFEVWLDRDGRRVPTGTVKSFPGPEHCDWQSATFLSVEGNQYIADPGGVLREITGLEDFDDDAELPADAVDTGYRNGDRRLWVSADRSVAYVVEGDRVQAWPSPDEPFGCG